MENIQTVLSNLVKRYFIEVVLIALATIITFTSFLIYINKADEIEAVEEDEPYISSEIKDIPGKIFIDVAGAVEKPDVYEVTAGARLKDVIKKAGGLSYLADRNFVARNLNFAQIMNDQEKVYIPSYLEIQMGLFTEIPQATPLTKAPMQSVALPEESTPDALGINSASAEELDTLPGVGKVTANKIIQSRPFSSIDELLNRKIIKRNVYENIKNLVTLN